MAYEVVYLKAKVGMMSLIGVGSKRPCSWGNYFWIDDGKLRTDYGRQYRVLNMWAENLEHARDNFLQTEENKSLVRCLMWDCGPQRGKFVLIQDDRIPADYYYNKLCFTGSWAPDLEAVTEMYSIVGDPENELEQFTDPVKYYEKRGANYNPKTGVISYTFKEKVPERPLKTKLTIEQVQDLKAAYGIDLEEELAKILHDEIMKEMGSQDSQREIQSLKDPDRDTLLEALNREQKLRDVAGSEPESNSSGETKVT